jgi:hypothetical protein
VSVRAPETGVVPTVDATVDAVRLPPVSVPSVTVPSVPTPVGPTPEVATPAVTVPAQVATPELAGGVVPGVTVDLQGTPRITIGRR